MKAENPDSDMYLRFHTDEFVSSANSSKAFKIHLLIAGFGSILSFICWLLVDFFVNEWPWFIYVAAFFLMTITLHFYLFIRNRDVLQLHFTWMVIINVILFLSWSFARGTINTGSHWYIYTLCLTGTIFCLHYANVKFQNSRHKYVYFHFIAYSGLNIMFFLIYLAYGTQVPWFIFAMLGLAFFLLIHWCVHFYQHNLLWKLHLYIFIDLQLLFFFIWIFTSKLKMPWFFFILLLWGPLLALHWWKKPVQLQQPIEEDDEDEEGLTPEPPTSLYPSTVDGTFSEVPVVVRSSQQ